MNNPWENLLTPSADISAKRIDHKHPLDFFWGKNSNAQHLMILELPLNTFEKNFSFPNLKGVKIIRIIEGDTWRLVLCLKDSKNWEIFWAFCNDILTSTYSVNSPKDGLKSVVNRIKKWKDLLKIQRTILTESEIKGLIGELYFLSRHLAAAKGLCTAVKSWLGPTGQPQDFCIDNYLIEVKAIGGSGKKVVKINSAEQLTAASDRKLYLYVVTLSATNKSDIFLSLPSLIKEIHEKLSDLSPEIGAYFNDLLLSKGYVYTQDYEEYCYCFLEEAFYHVRDNFPRITTANIPPGIIDIKYVIDLLNFENYRINPAWEEKNEC